MQRGFFRYFFSPPPGTDEDIIRRAKVLYALSASLIFAAFVGFAGVLFIFREKYISALALCMLLLAALAGYFLTRAGHIILASYTTLTVIWLLVTILVFVSGGTTSLDMMFYLTLTMLAGLLLGRSGMICYGGSALLAGIGALAYEGLVMPLPEMFAFPSSTGLVLLLINLAVLVPVLDMTLNALSQSIVRTHQSLDAQKQAQAELRFSEEKFSKAFKASPMAFIIQRASDNRYIEVNESFTEITGYSREEALGFSPHELDLYPDMEKSRELREVFQKQGYIKNFEIPFQRKDGEIRYGLVWGEPIELNGEKFNIAGTIDISERKQIEMLQVEQANEIATLYGALSSIAGTPDNIKILSRRITDIVVHNLNAPECGLWLISEDGSKIIRKAYSGTETIEEEDFIPTSSGGLIFAAIQSHEAIYAPDVRQDARYFCGEDSTRSEFVVPLQAHGEMIGAINMESPNLDDFSARTRRMVIAFAEHAALALHAAKLVGSLERNIADIKETQDRINFFLEHTAEGVYRVDYDPPIPVDLPFEQQFRLSVVNGKIGECNDAMAQMYGYKSRWEMLGKPYLDLYGEEGYEANLDANLDFFRQGYKVDNIETEEFNINKEKVYFLNNVVGIIRNGYFVSTWGTQREITSLKKAQAALEQANADLEERVAQRTAELRAVNKELESFSYSVSHDLRAPLRAIRGFGDIIMHDFSAQFDPNASYYLDKIFAAAVEMQAKIDGLLTFSRMSRAELRLQPINLSDMAKNICEQLSVAYPERTVDIVIAEGQDAIGDPVLIRNVLENLLGNAWKYSSKTPQAHIEFGCEKQPGKKVFFVKDNGVGFNMKYAGKLFGTFQRLHTTSEFEGHGIGLATVQRIIHRHGGEIWANSELNKGATFFFTIGNGS